MHLLDATYLRADPLGGAFRREAEYEQKPRQYCGTARAIGFSAIHKSYDLFAKPWLPCGA